MSENNHHEAREGHEEKQKKEAVPSLINQKGDSVNALTALDEAVALGMEDGYVRTFTDQLVPMAELLAQYINLHKSVGTDVCYDYAKSLLRLVRENVRIFRAGLPADQDIPLRPDLGIPQLSVKEYRVLRLLAAGRSNLEIAAELCLSLRTVKYYNTQISESWV